MKFSKNVNNKKCAPKIIFFNEFFFKKDSDIFWRRKLTLKVRILPFLTTFAQLSARLKNFLGCWLLVLGIKEGLVECATVCVKSVVILLYSLDLYMCNLFDCRNFLRPKVLQKTSSTLLSRPNSRLWGSIFSIKWTDSPLTQIVASI